MKEIAELADRDSLTVVGLMSGTSVDGIDAVVVDLAGKAGDPEVRQRAFRTVPIDERLRAEILAVSAGELRSPRELSHLDHVLGDAMGDAAVAAMADAGLSPGDVDLVGSHGQTILHDPGAHESWQIGEPTRIAVRVRAPVVSDFRRADQACGGQGAPLVPRLDAILFRVADRSRVLLNLGGMANVTVLPAGQGTEGVFAFDTGPGNVLIDEFLRHATQGEMQCDEDGRLGEAGRVDEELLAGFLEHPYFLEPPPKSTGREVFGTAFVSLTLGEWVGERDRLADLTATLTEFTAISITGSIREYVLPRTTVDEVLVSGGGVRNPSLMRRLKEGLPGIEVSSLETVGFSPDAKEAIAFAFLARETVAGQPGNVPAATGAARPAVLGSITPAPRG